MSERIGDREMISRYGMPVAELKRARKEGDLKYHKVGAYFAYYQEDIDSYLDGCCVVRPDEATNNLREGAKDE